MIALEQHASGIIVPVKAQPGARRNAITGTHAGQLKVSVTQAPEKGKANDALIIVLAEALTLSRSQISLMTGKTNGLKKFLISNISLLDLQARIESVLRLNAENSGK